MIDLYPLMPFLVLCGGGLLAMLLSAVVADARKVAYFSLVTLALSAAATVGYWTSHPTGSTMLFGGAVTVDSFSLFFYLLFLMIGAVSTLMAIPYLQRDNAQHGEYYTLMLFALAGMFVMVSSNDLITLFLGFETMSLAIYVLVGFRRHDPKSNEAVLKYYFLGAFAAGIFLYGIALVYGVAHTVNLMQLKLLITSAAISSSPLMVLGALMILVAVAFKVAAFPFHQWLPDIYEGAPTPVTAFMATAVKAAAFALVMRLFLTLFSSGELHEIGMTVIFYLAVLTMFVGNFFALVQQNIKRMLAFSSIAHTGYLLVGVAALPDTDAGASLMFYLVGYAFTNLGAIACVAFLQSRDERLQNIDDFAGTAWRYPLIGLAMTICMFSLIGFPPTAGFFGKYYLLLAAVKANLVPLVVIAIINSILSVFYYLRVVVVMYMKPEGIGASTERMSTATKVVVIYASAAVIWAGIGPVNLTVLLPGAVPLLNSARTSIQALTVPVGNAAVR